MNDLRRHIQRGCSDRAIRELLLAALEAGATLARTKAGVIVHGPTGRTSAHFTASDHRAVRNLRAALRRAGINV